MPLLELEDVDARYGAVQALHGISLDVDERQVVSVLGANGAGKTTTLRAISGTVRRTGGLRFDGAITAAWFDETDLLAAVNGFRAAGGQLRRPLRIGDTFWVRGYHESSPSEWQDLWDITGQARGMAKLAVASVAVGEVDAVAFALPVDDDLVAQGESAAIAPEPDRRDPELPEPGHPGLQQPRADTPALVRRVDQQEREAPGRGVARLRAVDPRVPGVEHAARVRLQIDACSAWNLGSPSGSEPPSCRTAFRRERA